MVTIIGQDREQNHKQQLEQTTSDGKFQTHFQLCKTKSIDEPASDALSETGCSSCTGGSINALRFQKFIRLVS